MSSALIVDNHSLHFTHGQELQYLAEILSYSDVSVVDREDLIVGTASDYGLVILSGASGAGAFCYGKRR